MIPLDYGDEMQQDWHMDNSRKERIRVTIDLTREVRERIDVMKDRVGAASLTDVLRRALTAYDVITEEIADGKKVYTRDTSGNETRIAL